ncbi:branched-chain amino acid ABC transporter permease [Kineosporia sp. A_224]|uniref:branched-chain amino acid ABC transporter permease n=1 Tax=Kineosporia sp. A_224 TaxID=1962180 RepID=UPI000B4BCCEF|nr:branched-chain amino acid ABC transporter permease [Kineosporia sp. A_224]
MRLLDAVVQGCLLGGQYALFAAGLSLVFGVLKVVNLAHGDLGILAAFAAIGLAAGAGLPLALAVGVVLVGMLAVGAALHAGLLARTTGALPQISMIATFGLSVVIGNTLQEVFSADPRALDLGSFGTAGVTVGGISVGLLPAAVLAVAVAALTGLHLVLTRTAFGRRVRATADDPATAALVGVDARRTYLVVTALAVGLAGLAGIAYAASSLVTPLAGPSRLIFAFEAVVIGGLGSLWGTLVGAVVLGVAQSVGSVVDPSSGVLAGHLVFLAVLATRPAGLLARTRVRA